MVAELSNVEVVTLGLVKRGANQKPFFIVKNLDGGEPMNQEEKIVVEPVVEIEEAPGEVVVELQAEGLLEKIKKLLGAKEVLEVEVLEEEVPEDTGLVEKMVALEKQQGELKVELEKARKTIEEEREVRTGREYLEKADAYVAVGASREEIAKVLRAADNLGEVAAKTIGDILKTADAAMRQSGIFEEKGTVEVEASDFIAKADKVAEKLMGENAKLSKAEALAQAYKSVSAQNPELAAEYVAERRNAGK